jgi:hypothetical protein
MMKSARAFTGIEILAAVAIVGLVTYAAVQVKHIFAPSKPVAAVTKLDTTAQASQQAASDAQQAAEAKIKADADERAARDKADAERATLLAGVAVALSAEESPSVNVQIAQLLNGEAAKTLPAPTLVALKQITDIVVGLREQNKNLKGQLLTVTDTYKAKAAEAEQATADAHGAQADADAKTAALRDASQKTVTLTKQVAVQAGSLKSWADDHETLLTRLKALGILTVIIAVVGFWIAVKLKGWKEVATDLVGERHKVQNLITEHAPAAESAIKAEVEKYWDVGADKTSQKTLAVVNDVKTKLRI